LKKRRVASITGTRADYGLMDPVYRAMSKGDFELHLVVTGMHHRPEFASSLAQIRADEFGTTHEIGESLEGIGAVLARIKPDVVLLQGDRAEMLAAAIAAAQMNVAIVHMSGGDYSGSIDDSIRAAISKLAHFHLTTCEPSTRRLLSMGEQRERIVEVGEPALDLLHTMEFISLEKLTRDLNLPVGKPFLIATLHPVTDEAEHSAIQMKTMLESLSVVGMPVVVTHPNTDPGGDEMRAVLESWKTKPFLRVVPNLGSHKYLSLLRYAAAMVGNSSSGLIEAPTLKVPVVNIGSRQHNRVRGGNVIDVGWDKDAIVKAIRFALGDADFRRKVVEGRSPYGDGHAAERTVDVLSRLNLGPALIAKWRASSASLLAASANAV
jgi:UDP-N-acetylglucosamine 2-epimerase (non-hydrolysing)/GDP/UDP-N,N'-diacetylbacillosamine 2-epimerase (hydrolysing)